MINEEYLKGVFEGWVRDQIDNGIGDIGYWDHMVGDEITEEDFLWINKNLYVSSIEINKVEEK